MRSIRIEFGRDPVDAASAISAQIEDVRIASAILLAAATAAEETLAHTAFATRTTPEALSASGPLGKIIRGCNAFEAAVAGRGRPDVNTAMPSAATLKSIAAVEAARAAMPDAKTQATIALVSKTIATVSPNRRVE